MRNSTLFTNLNKRVFYLFFFMTVLSFEVFSQVTFVPNPTNAAITTALNGGGLAISGATLVRGSRATQIATFSNGLAGANLGTNTGVYFSTGSVNLELSRRNSSTRSSASANLDLYNDVDLVTLDGNAIYDPLIYTFNITLGSGNTALRVEYQFGSEEYPDYVGSIYNDAFGFFVTGPGISGVANLAKLPSNNADITVNNVNYGVEGIFGTGLADLTQSAFYLRNGHTNVVSGTTLIPNPDPQPGPFPYFVEFNGLTSLITFDLVGLTPGATYTFKIAIADTGDQDLDSGVFIKKISGINGADVAVSKTVNNNTPVVGSNVVFTVNATNNGPYAATNVTVADLLPTGYTFVSATPSIGTYDSITGIWNIGNLNDGANATLLVTATVNMAGDHVNTAVINASEFDLDTSNNTASATTTPIVLADLSITKNVDNPNANIGSTVVFTITTTNGGSNTATNTLVTDLLPIGYNFVSAVPSVGTYNASTGIWSIGTLNNGASATLLVTATVNGFGNYINTATVTASETDPNLANNSASATITPPTQADVSIRKVVNNTNPNLGATVVFTLTASNDGTNNATNTIVTDVLPSGYTFVSAVAAVGSFDPISGIWNIGTLTVGANVSLQITATVNTTGNYVNTANITASEFDPNLANNTASAATSPILQADLSVTKTVSNATPNVGSAVVFTVNVINLGPQNATNTVVTDLLPSGYSLVSFLPSVGVYDINTGIWTIGTLNNGDNATLQMTVYVNATGNYLNTANVTALEIDPVLSNNTASAITVPVVEFDLDITKEVDNETAFVGTMVTFTITARNLGFGTATGVVVSDVVPSGYTLVSATPSSGSWVAPIWTIASLGSGVSETLVVTATVNASGLFDNTAVISGNEPETNTTNNSATATVTPVNSIDAINDDFTSNPINGNLGGTVGDVTLNDNLNGITVNDADIIISLADNGGIAGLIINPQGGVIIPAGTLPGTYTVTYTICEQLNPSNCDTAEVTIVVTIPALSGEIEVYQLVTPNGDGDNDVFIIENIELYPDNTVKIYNRWGVLVFETKGYGQGNKYFKGISNGRTVVNPNEELPAGTYYYVLIYKNNDGETKERAGYLYLTR